MTVRKIVVAVVITLFAAACGSGGRGPTVKVDEDVELSLSRACVVAGGEQVLMVRAPHLTVALFKTVYADGKSGSPAPFGAGYGGNDSEIVSESGLAEMRWKISTEAPPGPVVLDVGILRSDQESRELTFTLVGSEESCS